MKYIKRTNQSPHLPTQVASRAATAWAPKEAGAKDAAAKAAEAAPDPSLDPNMIYLGDLRFSVKVRRAGASRVSMPDVIQ